MSVQVGQFYRNKFTGYRAEVIRVRDSVSHSEVSVRLFSEDGAESLLWWASLDSLAARYELLPTVDEAHAEALDMDDERASERDAFDAITAQAVTIALQNLEIAALRRRLAAAESELALARDEMRRMRGCAPECKNCDGAGGFEISDSHGLVRCDECDGAGRTECPCGSGKCETETCYSCRGTGASK